MKTLALGPKERERGSIKTLSLGPKRERGSIRTVALGPKERERIN